MRILQLSPQFVFPPDDGGKIGIANIYYNFLKLGIDVELVCISNFEIESKTINKYKRNGNIHIIKKDTRNSKSKILKYFLTNKSLYIGKHFSPKILDKIEKIIDFTKIDVIHCDHSNMVKLGYSLSKTHNIPFGIRLHNIEYMIWQRYYEELQPWSLKRIFIKQQAELLKKAEKEFIRNADVSFAISYKDKERALELAPQANVINASAGVDLDLWKPDENVEKESHSLIIATTFNWIHNVNALRWFISKVLPELKKEYSNLSLKIIGKNPPAEFDNYKDLGVEKLGFVEDIKPYLEKAQVYIAPLFVGSGIRIKILEAMAMKLPVVATDISAEGIRANNDYGLYRANNEREFIDAIKKLFDDPEERANAGNKARQFIENNHTWEKSIRLMKENYETIVSLKKNKA